METKSAAHPEACTGVLLRKLASAGVRPTRQWLDLARAIFGAGNRHFTAEMLYHETRSDTKTGPHYHFYREDTEELSDIPEEWVPEFAIPAPDGTLIKAIDVIVRLKKV